MSPVVSLVKHGPGPAASKAVTVDITGQMPQLEIVYDAVQVCEISLGVTSRQQFEAWVRGPLSSLIPHRRVIVWLERADPGQAHGAEVFDVQVDGHLELARNRSKLREELRNIWAATGASPLLVPAVELEGARIEFPSEAILLVHGVRNLYGSNCLFILVGDDTLVGSKEIGTIALIAPYLQMAIQRISLLSRERPAIATSSNAVEAHHVLSAREVRVLECVRDGKSNQQIGDALNISQFTVKSHLQRIYRKLGVGTRAQAVATALTRRMLGLNV